MPSRWLSFAPLVLVTVLALALGTYENVTHDQDYFSIDSLERFRVLNYENQIRVQDLVHDDQSPVIAELLHANILMDDAPVSKNRGLVVTLDFGEPMPSILLLEPQESFSDIELATLAARYGDAIPEFDGVDIDQDVALEGLFLDWPVRSSENDFSISADDGRVSTDSDKIRVAIVDSGMDTEHEIFANITVLPGWNTFTDDSSMDDDVGHGTHIAGIVASKAPFAEIIPYKIVNAAGGKLSNVVEALSKAMENEVDVINTSFGLSSPSYALETLVQLAEDEGIIVVAAAGNNNKDGGFYPAQYEETLAVASVDVSGEKMEKSNFGSWVDVAAMGYHIRSALPNNEYGYKSGTSQATAIVTAAVARLLSQEGSQSSLSLKEVISGLTAQGRPIISGKLAGLNIVQ